MELDEKKNGEGKMEQRLGPVWADLDKPDLMVESSPAVPVYVAQNHNSRRDGLLYATGTRGIVWITKCHAIHTVGMRFVIDVVYLDRHNRVLEIVTYPPGRIGRPRWRASSVLEAEPGTFAVLGLEPGTVFQPQSWEAGSTGGMGCVEATEAVTQELSGGVDAAK